MSEYEPLPPSSFRLYPAIDLLGQDAVRLRQGAYDNVIARNDPYVLAKRFIEAGATHLHVVDLDAARSGHIDPVRIAGIVKAVAPSTIQCAGGVRSLADVQSLIDIGAKTVIVGTAAFGPNSALRDFVDRYQDALAVALDVRDGRVAFSGWTEEGTTIAEALDLCAKAGVHEIVCTSIERDGTHAGPNCELLETVRQKFDGRLTAAGGIGSRQDILAVMTAGCDAAIAGRALLDGSIPLHVLAEFSGANQTAARVSST